MASCTDVCLSRGLGDVYKRQVDWIQVRAVWGPHVKLDERDVLMPQVHVRLSLIHI